MPKIERPVPVDGVRQFPILFVEGNTASLDPTVLIELMTGLPVSVEALGPSHYVKSVAEALHPSHPYYYFLIDRDHHDERTVKATWRNFPDPKKNNLLIWRKRELESYFLIPEYMAKSQYCRYSLPELSAKIETAAKRQVFFDIANATIIAIREEFKANWISIFDKIAGFDSVDAACQKFLEKPEFSSQSRALAQRLRKERLKRKFLAVAKDFLAGSKAPVLGTGNWLSRIRAKKLLSSIINDCFDVRDSLGKALQGKDKVFQVVKDLLSQPIENQPDDFKTLREMLEKMVRRP